MKWWKDSGWSAISSIVRVTPETSFEDAQLDLFFFTYIKSSGYLFKSEYVRPRKYISRLTHLNFYCVTNLLKRQRCAEFCQTLDRGVGEVQVKQCGMNRRTSQKLLNFVQLVSVKVQWSLYLR